MLQPRLTYEDDKSQSGVKRDINVQEVHLCLLPFFPVSISLYTTRGVGGVIVMRKSRLMLTLPSDKQENHGVYFNVTPHNVIYQATAAAARRWVSVATLQADLAPWSMI